MSSLITPENVFVVCLWLAFTTVMLVYVVPMMASRRICREFGLVKVVQDGRPLYAVQGPDGEPVKIPIGMKEVNGKPVPVMGYAGLAWSLPTIAYQQTVAALMSKFYGKVGRKTQLANEAVLEGMPLDQAANAMALQAFAKGQYGKALMSLLVPKIQAQMAKRVNESGGASNEQL